jgi:hypothetical protein
MISKKPHSVTSKEPPAFLLHTFSLAYKDRAPTVQPEDTKDPPAEARYIMLVPCGEFESSTVAHSRS